MKILNVSLKHGSKYSVVIQDESEIKSILAKLIVQGYFVTEYSIERSN